MILFTLSSRLFAYVRPHLILWPVHAHARPVGVSPPSQIFCLISCLDGLTKVPVQLSEPVRGGGRLILTCTHKSLHCGEYFISGAFWVGWFNYFPHFPLNKKIVLVTPTKQEYFGAQNGNATIVNCCSSLFVSIDGVELQSCHDIAACMWTWQLANMWTPTWSLVATNCELHLNLRNDFFLVTWGQQAARWVNMLLHLLQF